MKFKEILERLKGLFNEKVENNDLKEEETMKINGRVNYLAQKWWKVWYARPLTESEKAEYERDIEAYEVDKNEVMLEMMRIKNDIF